MNIANTIVDAVIRHIEITFRLHALRLRSVSYITACVTRAVDPLSRL